MIRGMILKTKKCWFLIINWKLYSAHVSLLLLFFIGAIFCFRMLLKILCWNLLSCLFPSCGLWQFIELSLMYKDFYCSCNNNNNNKKLTGKRIDFASQFMTGAWGRWLVTLHFQSRKSYSNSGYSRSAGFLFCMHPRIRVVLPTSRVGLSTSNNLTRRLLSNIPRILTLR